MRYALDLFGAVVGGAAGWVSAEFAYRRWGLRGVTFTQLAWLALFVVFLVLSLAGCGAMFSPDNVDVTVTAPAGSTITLDGQFSGFRPGLIGVSAHERHVITASAPDGHSLGVCILEPRLQARYLVGDILLFESIVAPVVDAVTNDWEVIEQTHCNFGSTP